eukprot:7626278-Ditylum_brightwellii.AAC.1
MAVGEPGGGMMHSTASCELACHNVPQNAKVAHFLPSIYTSMLSVGKFCDADCFAVFTKGK